MIHQHYFNTRFDLDLDLDTRQDDHTNDYCPRRVVHGVTSDGLAVYKDERAVLRRFEVSRG